MKNVDNSFSIICFDYLDKKGCYFQKKWESLSLPCKLKVVVSKAPKENIITDKHKKTSFSLALVHRSLFGGGKSDENSLFKFCQSIIQQKIAPFVMIVSAGVGNGLILDNNDGNIYFCSTPFQGANSELSYLSKPIYCLIQKLKKATSDMSKKKKVWEEFDFSMQDNTNILIAFSILCQGYIIATHRFSDIEGTVVSENVMKALQAMGWLELSSEAKELLVEPLQSASKDSIDSTGEFWKPVAGDVCLVQKIKQKWSASQLPPAINWLVSQIIDKKNINDLELVAQAYLDLLDELESQNE